MKNFYRSPYPWGLLLVLILPLRVFFRTYREDPVGVMNILPMFVIPAAILLFLLKRYLNKQEKKRQIQLQEQYDQRREMLAYLMNEEELTVTKNFIDTLLYILTCYGIPDIQSSTEIRKDIYPFYISNQGYFLAKYYKNNVCITTDISIINTEETRKSSVLQAGPIQRLEIALQEYFLNILPNHINTDQYFSFNSINDRCNDKERGDSPELIVDIFKQ